LFIAKQRTIVRRCAVSSDRQQITIYRSNDLSDESQDTGGSFLSLALSLFYSLRGIRGKVSAAVTFVRFRFNRRVRESHSLLIPFPADSSASEKIQILHSRRKENRARAFARFARKSSRTEKGKESREASIGQIGAIKR